MLVRTIELEEDGDDIVVVEGVRKEE